MDALPYDCIKYCISRFLNTPYIDTQLTELSEHIIKWNSTGLCNLKPDYYLLKKFLPEYSMEQIYTYITDYTNLRNVSTNMRDDLPPPKYDVQYFISSIYDSIKQQQCHAYKCAIYPIKHKRTKPTHCSGGCIRCNKYLPYWWPSTPILEQKNYPVDYEQWNTKTEGFIAVGFCSAACHYKYTNKREIQPNFECKQCNITYTYTDLDESCSHNFCSHDCFDEYQYYSHKYY